MLEYKKAPYLELENYKLPEGGKFIYIPMEDNKNIRDTKDKLKKQLHKRFENGILDRLELELEIIKFYEVEKNYHKAFYDVIKKGLDAELIVQEPIFTEKMM